jgi:hypothetical protein
MVHAKKDGHDCTTLGPTGRVDPRIVGNGFPAETPFSWAGLQMP